MKLILEQREILFSINLDSPITNIQIFEFLRFIPKIGILGINPLYNFPILRPIRGLKYNIRNGVEGR